MFHRTCYFVTLLLCYFVTLLLCYFVLGAVAGSQLCYAVDIDYNISSNIDIASYLAIQAGYNTDRDID